jgi:hypothetical protein
MNYWLSFITSLPTENAILRQRAWRALKASGAAVLRDGVYLMPERESCRATLERLQINVREGGGTALVLRMEEPDDANFIALFDRSADYAGLLTEVAQMRESLKLESVQEVIKQARKLRKAFAAIAEIDFFPSEAQRQAETALNDLEIATVRVLSPDEPHNIMGQIQHYNIAHYQGRVWATRQRPWVDRLASAWLIRRFIDPSARILWIKSSADCPPDALGFDFDGAAFSHVASRVTFEVLLASFALEQNALARLGLMVHYLDVGGVQPPEAVGVESVLAGLRDTIVDDDQLLAAAFNVFDGLLASFNKGVPP